MNPRNEYARLSHNYHVHINLTTHNRIKQTKIHGIDYANHKQYEILMQAHIIQLIR